MMSTETLLRGAGLVHKATMSLEADPLYQEMLEEKKRLQVTGCNFCGINFCGVLF